MKLGCELVRLELPKARLFNREPYLVGVFFQEEEGTGEVGFTINPIKGVKKGEPAHNPDGWPVIPPTSVSGDAVLGRVEVWESDRTVDAEKWVERAKEAIRSVPALDNAADLALGGRRAAISSAVGVIGSFISDVTEDDFLAGFDVVFDPNDTPPGTEHVFSSPKANLTLRVTGGEE